MSEREADAQQALEEIKAYDLGLIPRRDDLGQALDFRDAVDPAGKIQALFNRIPSELVPDLSTSFVNDIYNQSMAFLNILQQIAAFNPQKNDNPNGSRESILSSISAMYDSIFNAIHPIVSFVAARQRDFSTLELEARTAKETAVRQAAELTDAMRANQLEADRVLSEIRRVAAEQGVSQQAMYFTDEASSHGSDAD